MDESVKPKFGLGKTVLRMYMYNHCCWRLMSVVVVAAGNVVIICNIASLALGLFTYLSVCLCISSFCCDCNIRLVLSK